MNALNDIRPSSIAGQWYPGDPARLADSVDRYLQNAKPLDIQGQVIGVIAPHAGHRYSGLVAGHAFAAVEGLKPALVAIISPMHHPYSQPLLTTSHGAYETPLGHIPVDLDAVQALDAYLREKMGFGLEPISRDPEHSLEIELPFLQRALEGDFHLLPVMMRDQSVNTARTLGYGLARVLGDGNPLLVASTDLSHFYDQVTAEKLDTEMLRRIVSFQPEAVLEAEKKGLGFACGRGAVAATLWAAQKLGADRVQRLHYATSGEITGDTERVVGYGAAVITRT
jgi:AmmeMemoRadiSam system protein B